MTEDSQLKRGRTRLNKENVSEEKQKTMCSQKNKSTNTVIM